MECLSFCLADNFNLAQIEQQLIQIADFKAERFRDVIIFHDTHSKVGFFFKNGTLVTWDYKRYQIKNLLEQLSLLTDMDYAAVIKDEFSYHHSESLQLYPNDFFNVDIIQVDSDEIDVKLAISYGLSTSIKLNHYELKLDKIITRHQPLLKKGFMKGSLTSSRKMLNKILSEIIATKSQINLSSEILYQPKFFWKHPNLEAYYLAISKYLDVQIRINTINHQLESLNETFELFNSYLINRHSHMLEVVIVILITVEIVFNVLNLHFSIN